MSDCPERARTIALGSGTLRSEEIAVARSHAEQCSSCRVVLSEVGTAPTMRVDLESREPTQATMTAPDRESTPKVVSRESRPWIGRYRVVGKLGAGGMGAVYAAEDVELDRRVAIKLLHGTSETASARLVREARALAKLRHPNVVTIYEVGRHEGDAFVAMELVEGITLRDWLHEEHSLAERLAVLVQAGRGLIAAHAEGLIHRDFKPENVMVGNNGRVQVLDFGLAKTAHVSDEVPRRPSDQALDGLTQTGTLLGTPAYMAPEQFVGDATDARTDQFAYCVTLFEAIHGFRPFKGATHAALHAAIVDRELAELPRRADVPARLEAAVLRGLAVDPRDRFPDMTALLAALEAPETPEATAPPRRRAGVALALVGVAAIGGGAAWWIGREPAAPETGFATTLPSTEAVIGTPLPGDRMNVTVHRLTNGLTVWISPDRNTPRIDARLVMRVGSRDANGVGGLAHIVEHMVLAGSTRLGTLDFDKEKVHLDKLSALYAAHAGATGPAKERLISEIDAESVAASQYAVPWELQDLHSTLGIQRTAKFTWFDASQFGVDIPSNKFSLWAKLEGERLGAPVFRGFHVESGVVFDEIHSRRSQGAYENMFDALFAGLFAGHPYELSPSGTYADLVAEPYTAAQQFHDTWYVPNNATLLLAGDVDPEQALRVLERELARWQQKPLPPRAPRPLKPLSGERRHVVKGADAAGAMIGWQAVPLGHADEEAVVVLGQVINRLAGDYAERTRLQSWDVRMVEAGMIGATVYPMPGRPVDDAIAALDELVRRIQAGELTDELLAAVLHNYKLALDRAPASNAARIDRMATAVMDDRGWAHELARSKRAAAVTKQDLVRVAKQYLTRDRVVIVAEVGRFEMPAVQRPKITPVQPKENVHSAFATQILAERIADIPPRFVNAGPDYGASETAIGPLDYVENQQDDTFTLRMVWLVGSRQLPLICAALHALESAGTGDGDAAARRARWFGRAQTVETLCTSDAIILEITGTDATFDAAWADTERWLSGAGIDDAVWSRAVREYLQIRGWGRAGVVVAALDDYASYGKASRFLAGADSARLARATATEIRQTLQTLIGTRRLMAYYGPRKTAQLPPGLALARTQLAPTPRKLVRQNGTRIVLLDTGPNRAVTATIRIGLGPIDAKRLAVARVFGSYLTNPILKNAFNSSRGITFSGAANVEEKSAGDDSSLSIQFSTTADHATAAIELALASARDPKVDPTHAAQAQRRNAEMFRANWIAPSDLGESLLFWRARGHDGDPRELMYKTTLQTDATALSNLATELARAPTYISISGDVSALDRAQLAKLGKVEMATPAALFSP